MSPPTLSRVELVTVPGEKPVHRFGQSCIVMPPVMPLMPSSLMPSSPLAPADMVRSPSMFEQPLASDSASAADPIAVGDLQEVDCDAASRP